MKLLNYLLFVWLLSVSSFILAAVPESAEQAIMKSTPEPTQYLGQIILSLVVVLTLIFLAAWLLKSFSRYPGVASGHLRVLGALSVGQKEKIILLQAGKDQIVVGVTTTEIRLLHQLSETVEVEEFKSPVFNSAFSKKLQEAISARKPDEKL